MPSTRDTFVILVCLIGIPRELPRLYAQLASDVAADTKGDWRFDRIRLISGKALTGLVVAGGVESDVELIEVRRLPGKPMNLVVRTIDRRLIAGIDQLDDSERAVLRGRLDQFLRRAKIEARRMDDVTLTSQERDGVQQWHYQGNWFWLESTADEETTRRAVVRLEQIFTAFRQIMPPRRSPQRRLKIMLFGSEDRYAAFLRGLGLEITNPAFFAADFNIVAAGSDINRFNELLAATRATHKESKTQLAAEQSELPARLAALAEQLKKNNVPEAEQKAIIAAEQRRQQERREKLLDDIAEAERRNAGKFDRVTGEMFSRLNHEAFHAYLDNCVYPLQDYNVPRWLNEGLALTFESGQLDADILRIDAPNRRVLQALQSDLRGPHPMPLAELLSADAEKFLPAHRGGEGNAALLYSYSWGLAYYLTFERSLLNSQEFAEFIAPTAERRSPVARFEKLVGQPLKEFEVEWRKAMLDLRG